MSLCSFLRREQSKTYCITVTGLILIGKWNSLLKRLEANLLSRIHFPCMHVYEHTETLKET